MVKFFILYLFFQSLSFSNEFYQKGSVCAEQILKIKNEYDKLGISESFEYCLSEYIKIESVNGHEKDQELMNYFQGIFQNLKIPYKVFDSRSLLNKVKIRKNIVATLSSSESFSWRQLENESIILLGHSDVVDVKIKDWEGFPGPFSGKRTIVDGEKFLWGRGALDMKGIAIMQLIVMGIIKNQNLILDKDIHLAIVNEEEIGGGGAKQLLKLMSKNKEFYSLSRAKIVLNEGGFTFNDSLKNKDLVLLGSEEKGIAWLELESENAIKFLNNLRSISSVSGYKKNGMTKLNTKSVWRLLSLKSSSKEPNVISSSAKIIIKGKSGKIKMIEKILKNASEKLHYEINENNSYYTVSIFARSSSHGSIGVNVSPLELAYFLFKKLGIIDLKEKKLAFSKKITTPATDSFIDSLSEENTLLKILNIFRFIPFVRDTIFENVEKSFGVKKLFQTSCNVSSININTDGKAKALVDCRLLHLKDEENQPLKLAEKVQLLFNDPSLKIKFLEKKDASFSDVDSKEMKVILNHYKNKHVVTPFLFPAGSDCSYFRNPKSIGLLDVKPINCYGFFPLPISTKLLKSIHGSKERIPLKDISRGVSNYYDILIKLSTDE